MSAALAIGGHAEHGTRARYVAGCRCGPCREANATRYRERAARAREQAGEVTPSGPPIESTMKRRGRDVRILRCPGAEGAPCVNHPGTWLRGGALVCMACIERVTVWDGLVSPDRARAHVLDLRAQGVGYKAVAEACDVAPSCIAALVASDRQIRASTERRILAVDVGARADGALVSAKRTRSIIARLVRRGFTRHQIAAELGYRSPALQIGRAKRVTARVEARLERLLRRVERGEVKPVRPIVAAADERAWLLEMIGRGVPASWLSRRLGFVVQRSDRSRRMRRESRDAVRRLREEVEALTVRERRALRPKYRATEAMRA